MQLEVTNTAASWDLGALTQDPQSEASLVLPSPTAQAGGGGL